MVARQRTPETAWKVVTEKKLAAFCVEVCGGGWNASQTAKAMAMLRRVYDDGYKGLNIEIVRADSVNR